MANNRLYLYHRPTGAYVHLGKRMSEGWYGAPDKERIDEFFQKCWEDLPSSASQDDFILLAEDKREDTPYIHNEWILTSYSQIVLNEPYRWVEPELTPEQRLVFAERRIRELEAIQGRQAQVISRYEIALQRIRDDQELTAEVQRALAEGIIGGAKIANKDSVPE